MNKDYISLKVLMPDNSVCCVCPVCKGIIVEKFYKQYGQHNGIIGPGSRTNSWVVSDCVCCDCGCVYHSTQTNKLDYFHDKRLKQATELLENTRPIRLIKDFFPGDILRKETDGQYRSFSGGIEFFKKGSLLRIKKTEQGSVRRNSAASLHDDGFQSSPYIVPKREGKFAELVWWQKLYYTKKPLPKSRKKELEKRIEADTVHKFKIPSASDKILLKNFNTAGTMETKKNKPLPSGSVKAYCVYISDFFFDEREVYIPENSFEYV